jgi:tripartite-type tricarboxylate transporter receptor subunit TctC
MLRFVSRFRFLECPMIRLMSAFAAVALCAASPASAQNYPSRAITIVVPFAQGGLTDVPVRMFASIMQEKLGVPVVVENKTGGSGSVGAQAVLRSEPDGYTLHANAVADTQNLHYIKVPYNAVEDFAHIGKIVEGPPLVLIIDAKLPHKTVAELIASAKANPQKYSFGSSGPASSPVIALNQLNAAAGTKIQDVPYRGSGQAAAAVVTGAIQGTFTFYSSAKPLVDAGQARALAVASPRRIASWPDVPTMEEAGFKGFDHNGFVGLAAPGKTPPQVIAFLNKTLNEVINTDLFKTRMATLGMTVAPAAENTPANFKAFMATSTANQRELAKLGASSDTPR